MKTKITRKAVREKFPKIICVGYAVLQNLLNYEQPKYYTCGYEGWHSDVYTLEKYPGIAIVTGYQPFGNYKPAYNLLAAYDQKADYILKNTIDYEKAKKAINALIDCFVGEVLAK